jgi:hypothetical protein
VPLREDQSRPQVDNLAAIDQNRAGGSAMSSRHAPRFRQVFLAGLLAPWLALTGCSPSDPAAVLEASAASLQTGDHDEALAGFEEVLASPEATPDQQFRAARDSVVCAGALGGDAPASEKFLRLRESFPELLTVDNLAKIATDLARRGCNDAAIEVIEVGRPLTQGDPEAEAKLQSVVDLIKQSATGDQLEKLRALGYL